MTDRSAEFHAMERELDLFAPVFDGFSGWRVMRNPAFSAMRGAGSGGVTVPAARRVSLAIRQTIRFLWLLLTARQTSLVVKTCVSSLRTRKGGKWYDMFFDAVLERADGHFKILEMNALNYGEQLRHAAFPGHLEPSVFTFWGRLLGMLFPAKTDGFEDRVAAALQQRLGLEIPPRRLRLRVSTVIWQARLYGLLLARLRPRLVLVSDTGEYGLRLACLRKDIRFAEVQHGIFDPLHPDAIPDWATGTNAELLIPDIFLAKGEYWIEQLKGFRQGAIAQAAGYEAIDEIQRNQRPRPADAPFTLLVTSQGLAFEGLLDFIKAIIAAAPDGLDWRMIIKLHPAYDPVDRFSAPLADCPHVSVVPGSREPNVYDLLSDADVHLSISSACHFDAAALGVTSFILPLPTHEILLHAIDDRAILLLEEPATVWRMAKGRRSPEAGFRYSAPGYVESVVKLVTA